MSTQGSRKSRAESLRRCLRDLPKNTFISPTMAEKWRRMIWDLEKPPFSELRRTIYMETIGGFDWGRR